MRILPHLVSRTTFCHCFLLCASIAVLVSVADVAIAADSTLAWPFRAGPTLNGHVSEADAKGLVTSFDEETGQNVCWKIALEGFGHSTPTVGDGKVWLTSATKDGTQQFVYCIDSKTGEILHHKLIFENAEPEPLGNEINTYASPSCALEQDGVFVHFGSYGTAKLNPTTAEIVWQRRDISCRHFRGPGSSPIIFQNLLILTFDGIDAQFLMALNKQTGETVWRTDRTTDYGDLDEKGKPKRDGDLRKAYSTPALVEVNGRTQVVSVGSRAGFGYDALTGKEIWGIRHDDFNAAATPCFYKDLAILNTGSRGANLMAVQLSDATTSDVTESHVKWNREQGNSDLASPVAVGNRVFMITNTGVGVCVNADTGEEVWKDRVGGTFTASPVVANGLIYMFNEEGDMVVVKAADKFEIVARSRLAEGMRSSPSAAAGRLYVRTFGHLYCLGK